MVSHHAGLKSKRLKSFQEIWNLCEEQMLF
ncbi:uncharacterized protein METZ01_LOCUS462718 [marine metagenome]|uniref:Uncharacterized protein n=1 Tax=marine metagenome TaxID=408172 RepID=A0A383AQ97_9ZZZZ